MSAMSLLEVEQRLLARAGKRGQRLAALQVLAVMVETLHHSVLLRKITQVSLEALSQGADVYCVSNVLLSQLTVEQKCAPISFKWLHLPFNAITPEMPSNVVQIILILKYFFLCFVLFTQVPVFIF